MLLALKGIGPEFAVVLWSEELSRHFDNRRDKLLPMPALRRNPGRAARSITTRGPKSGNPRLRTTRSTRRSNQYCTAGGVPLAIAGTKRGSAGAVVIARSHGKKAKMLPEIASEELFLEADYYARRCGLARDEALRIIEAACGAKSARRDTTSKLGRRPKT